MKSSTLLCRDEQRRKLVRKAPLHGIDYIEVGDEGERTLIVYFLGKAPEGIGPEHVVIEGGRRVTGIQVVGAKVVRSPEPDRDDALKVWVDRFGDFSPYRLSIVRVDRRGRPIPGGNGSGRSTYRAFAGFDSRYASAEFTFKVSCPTDMDCAQGAACPPQALQEPEISYLAKDYHSFRQLILDRLALAMPGWGERHVPDLGMTLAELLAYTGDSLSYYQDAVATEAYLDTARKRISVRRHVRLVDYSLHEGAAARSWVFVETSGDSPALRARQMLFLAGMPALPGGRRLLEVEELPDPTPPGMEFFEPVGNPERSFTFYAAHNRIRLYTWGDSECCLPAGATSAVLVDEWAPTTGEGGGEDGKDYGQHSGKGPRGYGEQEETGSDAPLPQQHAGHGEHEGEEDRPYPEKPKRPPAKPVERQRVLKFKVGDFLLLEEVLGARTGVFEDADPARRHVVRLQRVTPNEDQLTGQPLLQVEWDAADALPFPLCISSQGLPPECATLEDVSVARGNLILVQHGRTVRGEPLGQVDPQALPPGCEGDCPPGEAAAPARKPRRFSARLERRPLARGQKLPPRGSPACLALQQDPALAEPQVWLQAIPPAPGGGRPLFALEDLEDEDRLEALAVCLRQPASERPTGAICPPEDLLAVLRARLRPATRQALDDWKKPEAGSPPAGLLHALAEDLSAIIQDWRARPDLLGSAATDRHFVVETDEDGTAYLRFGEGDLGAAPLPGATFFASYRVGGGPSGNVGAESITSLALEGISVSGLVLEPRNPLPAYGGSPPEPLQEARLLAPHAFRTRKLRAVTAEDYADLVMQNFAGRVQRAAASLRWTGSGYEVLVSVDPLGYHLEDPLGRNSGSNGHKDGAEQLVEEIERNLGLYRRIGHDLTVRLAEAVPLDLGLTVRVLPNFLKAHVKTAILEALSSRRMVNGQSGYFHPDRLTFGEGVTTSRIIATVRQIPGVENVTVDALQRFGQGPRGEVEAGLLPLGPYEIARLDNDPDFPENGRLRLAMEGGR